MKLAKRILCFVLAAIFVISVCSCSVEEIKQKTTGGLEYAYAGDGAACILMGLGRSNHKDIIVPATYENLPVTSVRQNAFADSDIISIVLPEGMTDIGETAFQNCSYLEDVSLPSTLTNMSYDAFRGCFALKNFHIDRDNPAFMSEGNCIVDIWQKSVIFGNLHSSLPENEKVTTVDDYAFYFVPDLKVISVPKNITTITRNAYYGCYEIDTITVDDENPVLADFGNCLVDKTTNTLVRGCLASILPVVEEPKGEENGKNTKGEVTENEETAEVVVIEIIGSGAFTSASPDKIILPYGVTAIDSEAFTECNALTYVSIPSSLTYIGDKAFQKCENLTELVYAGTVEMWKDIEKSESFWALDSSIKLITCKNGTLSLAEDGNWTEALFPVDEEISPSPAA